MKKLKGQVYSTYEWWRNDNLDIEKTHIETLQEDAESRITEMRIEGFTEGQLIDNLIINDNIIRYTGWWKTRAIKTEE